MGVANGVPESYCKLAEGLTLPEEVVEEIRKAAQSVKWPDFRVATTFTDTGTGGFVKALPEAIPPGYEEVYTTVPPLNRDLAAVRETIKGLCDEIERLNLELAKLRQPVAETKPTFPARALHCAPMYKVGPA